MRGESTNDSREEFQRPLVLLIDDCVEQRELYELVLESDLDVIGAGRGAEGVALAVRRHPDAIVLDVDMPEMDGVAVCRLLKSDPATSAIPVLMLTGVEDPGVSAEALAAGAVAILKKPCSPDMLRQAIEYALVRSGRR